MAGKLNEDKDFQVANEAFGKGQFAEALELLTKVAERYPDDHELTGRISLCSFELAIQRTENHLSTSSDWQGVIENLESALEHGDDTKLDSSLAVAHHNLAVCLNQQEDFEEAEEHFQRALAIDPELTDASISLAINYADRGKADKAEQMLQEVIERVPGALEARQALGLILSSQGREAEAVEEFKRAQPPERDNFSIHYSRGVSLLNKGEEKEAEEAFRQTVDLNPEFVPALYNLGLILRNQKNFSGAEHCFEEVTRLAPNDPGGHFCLANLYERRNMTLAITSWEKYLELAAKVPGEAEMVANVVVHLARLKKKCSHSG